MQGSDPVLRPRDPRGRGRARHRSRVLLALDTLDGSIFRMLRQGRRVVFDLDDAGLATKVRIGAEVDMGLPTAEV